MLSNFTKRLYLWCYKHRQGVLMYIQVAIPLKGSFFWNFNVYPNTYSPESIFLFIGNLTIRFINRKNKQNVFLKKGILRKCGILMKLRQNLAIITSSFWTRYQKICTNVRIEAPFPPTCLHRLALWLTPSSRIYKRKTKIKKKIFVKIRTFILQISKLLRNRRKAYILDVVCNRFYFGEVQKEGLDQCTGKGILAPRTEGLSIYQWPILKKNKQGYWGNAFVNTSLNFLGLSWKFWKTQTS